MTMIKQAPTRGLQRRLTRHGRVKVALAAGRSYKPRNLAKSVTVE
jgi:hypothetical protein